jgi:hypothetical protein
VFDYIFSVISDLVSIFGVYGEQLFAMGAKIDTRSPVARRIKGTSWYKSHAPFMTGLDAGGWRRTRTALAGHQARHLIGRPNGLGAWTRSAPPPAQNGLWSRLARTQTEHSRSAERKLSFSDRFYSVER